MAVAFGEDTGETFEVTTWASDRPVAVWSSGGIVRTPARQPAPEPVSSPPVITWHESVAPTTDWLGRSITETRRFPYAFGSLVAPVVLVTRRALFWTARAVTRPLSLVLQLLAALRHQAHRLGQSDHGVPAVISVLVISGLVGGGVWWYQAEQRAYEEWVVASREWNEASSRRFIVQDRVEWQVREHRRTNGSYPWPSQVPLCPPWQDPFVVSVSAVDEIVARCDP